MLLLECPTLRVWICCSWLMAHPRWVIIIQDHSGITPESSWILRRAMVTQLAYVKTALTPMFLAAWHKVQASSFRLPRLRVLTKHINRTSSFRTTFEALLRSIDRLNDDFPPAGNAQQLRRCHLQLLIPTAGTLTIHDDLAAASCPNAAGHLPPSATLPRTKRTTMPPQQKTSANAPLLKPQPQNPPHSTPKFRYALHPIPAGLNNSGPKPTVSQ